MYSVQQADLGEQEIMDFQDLKESLENRLDNIDEKIGEGTEEVKLLREDITDYRVKTAVLENQMAGIVKIGFVILTSIVGLVTYALRKGL